MSKKKKAAITLAAIMLATAGIYLAGRYYFTDHFYMNTKINSVDCSFKTNEESIQLTADHLNDYGLIIRDEVTDMIISASDAGLKYDNVSDITKLLEAQDETMWFKEFYKDHTYSAMSTSLDEEKMKAYLNTLECMNPAKPQKPIDAKIIFDEASQSFKTIPETIGNTIIEDAFYAAVSSAMLNGEGNLDLTTTEYYLQPKYKAADELVKTTQASLDKYMQTVINYEHADLTYTLDSKDFHKFIKVSKDFKISFEKEKIKEYITKKISPVFNTVGQTRKLTSPGSGNITISGGTFGWQVGLIAEREKMIEDIKKGEVITRQPEYLQDARSRDKENDIGNTYVDVSISDQTLWVVKDGKVEFTTPFVSGNPSKGHETDKGVYMIEYKKMNYEMRDYNVTVKYWLPFNTDVGEGFHDATWRSSFGSNIYTYNGSHGCVNLPFEAAKTMYNMLPVGYPVIVH